MAPGSPLDLSATLTDPHTHDQAPSPYPLVPCQSPNLWKNP